MGDWVCKARRHKSNQKTVRTATLLANPTEHIISGDDLIFVEVEVLHVDKKRKRVLIDSPKWRTIPNWGVERRDSIGWRWLYKSMNDGIREIGELKDKYEAQTAQ